MSTTTTPSTTRAGTIDIAEPTAPGSALTRLVVFAIGLFERIPNTLIAFIARFSIAAVFWNSGQTKVQGFVVNPVSGEFTLGWPRLSDSALALFQDEYKLPFIPPELAAPMAATAEHVLPLLILMGLGTRFAALGLLGMTLVIQLFVYPGAYATHGTWAALLLYLMARGPGMLSVDHWLVARRAVTR
jgi:putative oxidoreductase